MKSLFFSVVFMLTVVNLTFCQTTEQQQAFDQMLKELLTHSVPEVKAKDLIGKQGIIYLDAREKVEYQTSHIPNARWIGYDNFKKKNLGELPKDKKIIVYCSVGYRSEKISEKLLKLGYQDVSNLYGGIFDWKHAGGTLVDAQNKETDRIHTFNKAWSKWLFQGIKVF